MDNIRKYLPSKKFITVIVAIIIIIIGFFVVKWAISAIKNRRAMLDSNGNVIQTATVASLVQKDSNNNGIEDWEEYLWGLDPAKNGDENKDLILAKKKDLEKQGVIQSGNTGVQEQGVTQNALLARQLFATILTLQQSGSLNEDTIKSLAESIGQEIETTPIPDKYTKEMVKVTMDSSITRSAYLKNFGILFNKYKNEDIGDELTIVAQGIVNNDPQALYSVKSIANAYRNFGKELMGMSVPSSIADIHLELANNYEKTAQSIEGLTQLIDDPIIGMKSILDYKKYNDALVSDINKMSDILQ